MTGEVPTITDTKPPVLVRCTTRISSLSFRSPVAVRCDRRRQADQAASRILFLVFFVSRLRRPAVRSTDGSLSGRLQNGIWTRTGFFDAGRVHL